MKYGMPATWFDCKLCKTRNFKPAGAKRYRCRSCSAMHKFTENILKKDSKGKVIETELVPELEQTKSKAE